MNNHTKAAIVAAMTLTSVAFAAPDLTSEQREERKAAVVARVGGLLRRPGTPAGCIAVVNAQKVVPVEEFKATYAKNVNRVRGVDHWMKSESVDVKTADTEKRKLGAQIAVFIVDSKALPMSLIALEECWAIMNVRPLVEGADKTLAAHRAKNEFARVLGVLCGGASSQFPSAIMNGVSKPSDLNGCTDELPVDVTAKIPKYLEKRGVKGERLTSYQKACREGWAPAPTNEIQRAIWNEVRALPQKPLKIEFDPKKGK